MLLILALGGAGLGLFAAVSQGPSFSVKAEESSRESAESQPEAASEPEDSTPQAVLTVHVAGAVAAPGVYSVPEGSRVQDAVTAAGGFASDASSDAVNLARALVDGEQVFIPTAEQVQAGVVASPASSGQSSEHASLVNINTADASALETLSGVGPATAAAIISDREENGPFASIEDIQRVSGIGEKKYEAIKDAICV